jgi:hypothetical protein
MLTLSYLGIASTRAAGGPFFPSRRLLGAFATVALNSLRALIAPVRINIPVENVRQDCMDADDCSIL